MTFFQGVIPNPSKTDTRIANTSVTTVVASKNQPQMVALVRIVNVDGAAAVDVTVDIYNGTTATQQISTYPLAADGLPLEIRDIFLELGESLRVTSGDADGQLHVHAIHNLTNIQGR